MGDPGSPLGGVAVCPGDRSAGHGDSVASRGVQAFLDPPESSRPCGSPCAGSRARRPDPQDVEVERDMGRSPHPQRARQARGIEVAVSTIARYMVRQRKPPSPTWRTFLDNHVKDLVAIDFFTVPTATFGVLFGFLVLAHDRRRVLHFT